MAARAPRSAVPALPLVAAAFAVAAGGCALPRGTRDSPVVMEVRLPGARALDPSDIVPLLATQPVPRYPIPVLGAPYAAFQATDFDALFSTRLPPSRRTPIVGPPVQAFRQYQSGGPYRLDLDALAIDRKRVEAYYRERGYFEARVEEVRIDPAGPGRVTVAMRVAEGRPARVRSIATPGLDEAPEARAHLRELPIAVGDVFTVAKYDAARAALETALHEHGYATATVEQQAQIVPEADAADLTYTVKPGRAYQFGSVFVSGTAAVSRQLIRDQVQLELRPGELYAEQKLAKAQARVFDLGVFGGARVTAGTPDEKRGTVPVVVAVRESPFRTVRFGPGVGIESQRLDANLLVGWTHRNWYGDLRRLSVDLRLGYAWLLDPTKNWYDVAAVKEGVAGLLTNDFSQPRVLGSRIDTAVRTELEKGIEAAYTFYSERLRLSAPVRITPALTFVPSYNVEVYQVDTSNPVSVGSSTDNTEVGDLDIASCPNNVCLLSYLQQQLTFDGRNDPVNTRKGVLVSLSVQEGFRIGTHGYRYLRFLPEARGYVPLAPRWVLATRAQLGALVPIGESGDPPIVARFFSGGANSMRGYYSRRLSPLRQRSDGELVPVGGNGLAEGSVELRYALSHDWRLVGFVDTANVADVGAGPTTWRTVLELGDLQAAAGLGLRYQTPVGPIRLDAAYRLRPGQNVPFSSHEEPAYAVHITVGEAF